jgi:hypothetical protein
MRIKMTYSPLWVLYRSVNARLVGVLAIQPASLEINIALVDGDAMAATHISQSAVYGSVINFGDVVMGLFAFSEDIAGV